MMSTIAAACAKKNTSANEEAALCIRTLQAELESQVRCVLMLSKQRQEAPPACGVPGEWKQHMHRLYKVVLG